MGMKSLFDLMSYGGIELGETALLPEHQFTDQSTAFTTSFEEIDSVIDEINNNNLASTAALHRKPAALFGDVCTVVNEPVAMASKYWDILHLSYAETHPKFSTADAKDVKKKLKVLNNFINFLVISNIFSNGSRRSKSYCCSMQTY